MTKKTSKWRRRGLVALGVVGAGVPALWIAIHQVPGLGPALADGARALFGPKAVAWAEDVSYGIQDRIDGWRYKDTAPKTFWEAPAGGAAPAAAPAPSALPAAVAPAAGDAPKPAADDVFPPPAFTPPHAKVATPGDGTWIPMTEGSAPGQPPVMFKAMVHPDPNRSWAAIAVVAVDLRRVDLHLVAGTQEPQSTTVPSNHRPGLVPKEVQGELFAVFNGGFKATHGHYAMMIDGETFLPPRDKGCTIGMYRDGTVRVMPWPKIKDTEPQMAAYRQTPPCLVEEGKTNNVLEAIEYNRDWGSTVSGETVIRRSALGVDKTGRVVFYGLGDAVTAQALARGMHAAGVEAAAQLDVNYSFPRFLLYDRPAGAEGPRATSALIPQLKWVSTEYVSDASPRDFFYLTRRKSSS